jgi:hypothetical protein
VRTVAGKVSAIMPTFSPPAPAPADDEGILNVASYFVEFVGQQSEQEVLGLLANALC